MELFSDPRCQSTSSGIFAVAIRALLGRGLCRSVVAVSIGVIISLMLTSGVVSAVVSHHLTKRMQELEFRRGKIEELFLAVQSWCTAFSAHNVVWPRVMQGVLDYNEALDLQIANPPRSEGKLEMATMLVNIYFRSLREQLQRLIGSKDSVNSQLRVFQESYRSGGPHSSHAGLVRPFHQAMVAFEDEQRRFNDALFEVAERLNTPSLVAACQRITRADTYKRG